MPLDLPDGLSLQAEGLLEQYEDEVLLIDLGRTASRKAADSWEWYSSSLSSADRMSCGSHWVLQSLGVPLMVCTATSCCPGPACNRGRRTVFTVICCQD
jgi:hypothetical protein